MIGGVVLQRMIAKRSVGELKCMKNLQRCYPNIPIVFCRTCLNTKHLRPVFSKPDHKEMSDNLKLVTGLEIEYNDGLSQMICETCLNVIDIALQFRSKSKNAQETLINMVKTQKIEIKSNKCVELKKEQPYFEIEIFNTQQLHQNEVTTHIKKEFIEIETDNNFQSDKTLHSEEEVQSISNGLLEDKKHQITLIKNIPEVTIKRVAVKIEKGISSGKEINKGTKNLVKRHNAAHSIMKNKRALNIVRKEFRSGINKISDSNNKSRIIKVSNLPLNWDKKDPNFMIPKPHAKNNKKTLASESSVSQIVKSDRRDEPDGQSELERQSDSKIQSDPGRQNDPKSQGESEISIEPEENKKCGIFRVHNLPENWDKKSPDCKINGRTPSQYEKHMIKITSNPDHLLYKCRICSKTYQHLVSYRAHEQVHTNSSVCELCGKKCRNEATLKEHQRAIHGFKKIHKCSYCEASFPRKEPLQVHERRHKNERPYICDYCGSGFMTRATLTQHIGTHLPPTVQCPLCPLKLKSQILLINHKAQKHGKRYRYLCPICLKEFHNNKYTHKHLSRTHGLPSAQHPPIEKRLRTLARP